MSGICGIRDLHQPATRSEVNRMLTHMWGAPNARTHQVYVGDSIGLGVADDTGQHLAAIPGLSLAMAADLTNVEQLREASAVHGGMNPDMPLAEVLAWLYKLRGVDFVHLLQGGFSFALWDENANRLILAVDRVGIYRLYWSQQRERLVFSSRLSAVRDVCGLSSEVNPASLIQFLLFSAVPAPLTIASGIERLEPGCLLVMQKGHVERRRYWDLKYDEDHKLDAKRWATEVRNRLRSSVHRTLQGCRPDRTGAYLSGGTDSSSVVAFMTECYSSVNTFSIFFEDQAYSEIDFARIAAHRFGATSHEYCVTPQDTLAAIPLIARYFDEPFANSSAIGAYYCALTARRSGIDTLLAGDGGDELFAGNERYSSDRRFAFYGAVPRWARRLLIEPCLAVLPDKTPFRLPMRYIRRASIPNPNRIVSYNYFLSVPPDEIFDSGLIEQVPRETWLQICARHFNTPQPASELNRLLYMDMKMTIADNDLLKVVGTAELAGVRVRFPLLDNELVEFAGRIPSALKMKRFQKRYIFKQAMRGILPERILYKHKHGFGVPLGSWLLRNPRFRSMVREVLDDRVTQQRGYFQRDFLKKLMASNVEDHTSYYGEVLWHITVLELWHRYHFERSREVAHEA